MKFRSKASGLKSSLEPVALVAMKGTQKDFTDAKKITLDAQQGSLLASAFGGNMSIRSEINNVNNPESQYSNEIEGKVTVHAQELIEALDSMPPSETLIVELRSINDSAKELVFTMGSDEEQFQTISCFPADVDMPPRYEKEIASAKVNRLIFADCLKRIGFAFGEEDYFPQYFYWRTKLNKNEIRFIAGTGARFAMTNFTGDGIVETGKEMAFILHKTIMGVMSDLLNISNDDLVSIKQVNQPQGDAQRVLLLMGCHEVCVEMVSSQDAEAWDSVNEKGVIGGDKAATIVFEKSDLDLAVKGIIATYTEDMKKQNQTHVADAHIDIDKKCLYLKTNTRLKSQRKLSILDGNYKEGDNVFDFSCASRYLGEFSRNYRSGGRVQMEFIGDQQPVLLWANAQNSVSSNSDMVNRNDSTGVEEQYLMFFLPLSEASE